MMLHIILRCMGTHQIRVLNKVLHGQNELFDEWYYKFSVVIVAVYIKIFDFVPFDLELFELLEEEEHSLRS